ncbi:ATP-binding protein [Streptomyces longwoodensis]|uniref:ATP-binding protein n=1 Tax=Streptomyces longwoodensis TaxID=68231 RepID=UPI0033D69755
MLGRDRECETLDELAARVGAGRSAALVVRGEAGIGKTALLQRLAAADHRCRVVRVGGSETEMELPFAGLHQLCGPLLDAAQRLPEPQCGALRTAFGLAAGPPAETFLLGVAVLNLLAEAAREQPLICLVDDVQWLDRASVQILGFVARRLEAEGVGIVCAVREPAGERVLDGLPELLVSGLGEQDAHALLRSVIPGRLDAHIEHRIVAESRGNPLALIELPRGITLADLPGGLARPDTAAPGSQVEDLFRRRVQALPEQTRRLLLVAAAEPVGDMLLLRRAVARMGLDLDAATPALAQGLIELGGLVRFRHPLVRSAAYRTASQDDRIAAHRALADAIDPALDADRRAWHLALATVLPDEEVAVELVRCAGGAQRRGGLAAAAAFLERAMELTPDLTMRSARALAAAEAKFEAAAVEAAHQLAGLAEAGPLDDAQRARLARLNARVLFTRSRSGDAIPLFLEAARRLAPHDPVLARESYLEALACAIYAGRLNAGPSVQDIAEAARATPACDPPNRTDRILDGVTTRFTDGYAAAVDPLRKALGAFRSEAGDGHGDTARWLWLACPVAPEPIAPELWNDEAWYELAERAVDLSRGAGALGALPVALTYRAGVHVQAGEFDQACALLADAAALSEATGRAPLTYPHLMLAAWREDEEHALRVIGEATQTATARGEGRALGLAHHATAVLCNGLARHDLAFEHARRACAYEDVGFYGWYLAELVEAGVLCGEREAAAVAQSRLQDVAQAAATDWALGVMARCRAQLSEGQETEKSYQEAVERLGRTRMTVELARSHLLYGEWLRRHDRRHNAREHLRTSHELFRGFGAAAFTARAAAELRASGETVAARGEPQSHSLTAQEAQIARLAADGLTNPQIAARLVLSPHTVEWHLRKVFAKLGVTSRRRLDEALRRPPRGLGTGT